MNLGIVKEDLQMKRFIIPLITVVAVLGIIFAGCVPGAAPEAPPVAPPEAPPEAPPVEEWPGVVVDEWKIPSLCGMTGPYAAIGMDITWCYEWAVDQVNAAGGVEGKPIVLETHDDESEPTRAAAEISKVIDWALVVLGPWDGEPMRGAMPIAIEEGLYCMNDCAGVDFCVEYQPWALSMLPRNEEFFPMGVKAWLKQEPDIEKICCICPERADELRLSEAAMAGAEEMGVEVEWVEFPTDIVDFGAPAVKALATEAQGFWFGGYPGACVKIFMEMKNRGALQDNSKVCVGWHMDTPDWWETAAGYMEGVYCINPLGVSEDPGWLAFSEWKVETHDVEAFAWNAPEIDEVFLIKQCFEDLKITGDPAKLEEERIAIRDYMNNVEDFDGIVGTYSIVNGVASGSVYLQRSEDDMFVIIGKVDPEGNLLPLD